jgi:predicted kinase
MNEMNAYIMVGAPGSGKSTQAQKIADTENASIVSGDRIRYELYGDASIQGDWTEIHDRIEAEVSDASALRRPVILDGTHYRASYRKEAVAMLRSYGYDNIEAVVVNPSLATCLARNFQRSRNVPDYVIKEIHGKLQSSLRKIYDEPFDRFNFVL